MRRSLAILLVAAATAVSGMSFAPAQAAPALPKPITATDLQSGIELVDHRRGHKWDRGNHRWRDGDRWGGRHHRRSRRDNFFPNQFYFGFGVPYYAPRAYYRRHYQPYYGYGDCFRTWDGQLVCR